MTGQGRLSNIIQDEVRKAVHISLQKYISTPPEKRQEAESQGFTLANLLFNELLPTIHKTQTHSVLVIMEEGIGNMVMLTPMIKSLKNLHPRIHLTVWCKEPAAQVIQNWDLVDKVITEFDNCFYDLCFVSIWGKQTKQQYAPILDRYCKAKLDVDLKKFHEALQHLSLADFLGCPGDLPLPYCQIEKIDIKYKKYIVFGDTTLRNFGWDRKRWPHYVDLAKIIYKKFPEYKIVLIGDEEDKKDAQEKDWPENVVLDFMGGVTIPQLAYLIKNADIYIGNDTGPTHIAAAVGTKTYAIFAPTLVSKNKPLGEDVTILNKNFPCSPCQYTERWETCNECIAYMSAEEVYDEVFFSEGRKKKPVTLLVGAYSNDALRIEHYIKDTLEKEFKHKVVMYDYRFKLKSFQGNALETSYDLLNEILQKTPDTVLICGRQQIVPNIFSNLDILSPKTKMYNWYADNRGGVEQWFVELSSVCHKSFWTTGDPNLLSKVFSQTQRPCEFLPVGVSERHYYPVIGTEKDIDVLFVGVPHSAERIKLLETIVQAGIKIQIYGNGNWPESLKAYVKPGVFNQDFNKVLNRAKLIVNQNIINSVPLYFSDRYFYPMAVKSVGINRRVPLIEDMFEDNKHMILWTTPEECVEKIKSILKNDKLRTTIAEEGYKLYTKKYTLKHTLGRMFNE